MTNRAREILAAQHDEIFAGARRDSILKSIWTVDDDLKAIAAMEAYATERVVVERERNIGEIVRYQALLQSRLDALKPGRREMPQKLDLLCAIEACTHLIAAIRTPVGDE